MPRRPAVAPDPEIRFAEEPGRGALLHRLGVKPTWRDPRAARGATVTQQDIAYGLGCVRSKLGQLLVAVKWAGFPEHDALRRAAIKRAEVLAERYGWEHISPNKRLLLVNATLAEFLLPPRCSACGDTGRRILSSGYRQEFAIIDKGYGPPDENGERKRIKLKNPRGAFKYKKRVVTRPCEVCGSRGRTRFTTRERRALVKADGNAWKRLTRAYQQLLDDYSDHERTALGEAVQAIFGG